MLATVFFERRLKSTVPFALFLRSAPPGGDSPKDSALVTSSSHVTVVKNFGIEPLFGKSLMCHHLFSRSWSMHLFRKNYITPSGGHCQIIFGLSK